jgi:hypothetical protein
MNPITAGAKVIVRHMGTRYATVVRVTKTRILVEFVANRDGDVKRRWYQQAKRTQHAVSQLGQWMSMEPTAIEPTRPADPNAGRQFCRKCLRSCFPAVTLDYPDGGRLHWCAEDAADAEAYIAAVEGETITSRRPAYTIEAIDYLGAAKSARTATWNAAGLETRGRLMAAEIRLANDIDEAHTINDLKRRAADEAEAYLDERQIGRTHSFSLDYLATEGFNGALTPSFATWAAAATEHGWFTEIVVEAGPNAYGEVTFRAWDGAHGSVGGRWVRYYFWSPMAREDALDEQHAKARVLNMFLDFMGAFVPNPAPGSRVDEADQFVMWTRRNHTLGAGTEAWYVAFLADEAAAHELDAKIERRAMLAHMAEQGATRNELDAAERIDVAEVNTITDREVESQVIRSLDGRADEFDVKAITRDIIAGFGRVDIDTVPFNDYWAIVRGHDLSATAAAER